MITHDEMTNPSDDSWKHVSHIALRSEGKITEQITVLMDDRMDSAIYNA